MNQTVSSLNKILHNYLGIGTQDAKIMTDANYNL